MSKQDEAVDVGLAHKDYKCISRKCETNVIYLLTLGSSKWTADMSAPR